MGYSFDLDYVVDSRLNLFLDYFVGTRFTVRIEGAMPDMQIALPASWPQYLAECVGATTRRNIRQRDRRIERQTDLRLQVTRADGAQTDIDALLSLWQWRWGPKPFASWERRILRHCFAHDCLRLTVLWLGATPVGALACIIDQPQKTVHAYIVAYNARYADLSASGALFAESIRHAIENGFRVYDFLLGSDGYKFSFGAQPRREERAHYAHGLEKHGCERGGNSRQNHPCSVHQAHGAPEAHEGRQARVVMVRALVGAPENHANPANRSILIRDGGITICARAFATGYITALLDVVNALGN